MCMIGSAGAAAVNWGGHWYEKIDAPDIEWINAKTDAEAKGGYLVVITSAAENSFLTYNSYLGDLENGNDLLDGYWTGGYQIDGSDEPDQGWAWVNGEAFSYNNWGRGGEPNNYGDENRIVFAHNIYLPDGKEWNDREDSGSGIPGYIVEYDTKPVSAVPIPSTLFLTGFGIFGLAGAGRRKK
jgi:hypothetical protein